MVANRDLVVTSGQLLSPNYLDKGWILNFYPQCTLSQVFSFHVLDTRFPLPGFCSTQGFGYELLRPIRKFLVDIRKVDHNRNSVHGRELVGCYVKGIMEIGIGILSQPRAFGVTSCPP